MGRLAGKVAIITGAASGMGQVATRLFADESAKIVATDIASDGLHATVKETNDAGGAAIAVLHDVSSLDSWQIVVDETLATFGKIDILINNAGVHIAKGILQEDIEGWNRVMAVNCTGVWLGMKSVIPHMQVNGKGSIVNTSSSAAIVGGMSDMGGVAYSASKGAVRSMTKHAAQWFAKDNIRVNSVHPAAIFTPMSMALGLESREQAAQVLVEVAPLPPHCGEPLDIAYGYLYLASDESKFVTGEELIIDGGMTTH